MAETVKVVIPIADVVAHGLELATILQTYIEADGGEPGEIDDVSLEISSTASILRQLQEIIDADKTCTAAQTNLQVLKDDGRDEIEVLAAYCEKTFTTIITLVTKTRTAELWGKMPAHFTNAPTGIVGSLCHCTKWRWLNPRIKRCHEQLRWLKLNLLLHLQLANLARAQIRLVINPLDRPSSMLSSASTSSDS